MYDQTMPPPPSYTIVGSPEQDAIWDAIANGRDHVVVKALAGTGKSFTCREAMNRTPTNLKVLYLAFNKVIADEFGRGAPANCEVKTINAIGFRVVRNNLRTELDGDKLGRIVEDVFPRVASNRAAGTTIERLVALCKAYLLDGTDIQQVTDLATRHEIEIDMDAAEGIPLIAEMIKRCRTETGSIDFDDQVWLPVVLDMPAPRYDLVFVDEAQDLNPCQHALALKLLKPGTGRLVIVGDDHQAIYGWRGSDVDSIDNLSAKLGITGLPVTTLPLTVTRRCPRKVVAEAQKYVPDLRHLPDAPDGEVHSVKDRSALEQYKPGDMVVCRTNAPLLGVAYQLIRRQVKAVVRGRDIGRGLQTLIRQLRADSMMDLMGKLEDWECREITKVSKTRRAETAIQRIQDRAECLRALSDGCATVTELNGRIEQIFADFESGGTPKNAVVLSSIHRAKGLEADTVFWLYPDIKCPTEQDWQRKQETNLRYVAVTRAKLRLVYVNR